MTAQIARRGVEDAVTAGALLGTSDPEAAIERAVHLADLFMRVLRERSLARRFGDSERDFIELGGWQVLAAEVGVTAVVVATAAIEGGFESRAEVRTPDGRVIGAASGQCTTAEPNWRRHSAHDLRAMSETRAIRRALRLVLGFIPALAGMDFSDPDAPATRKQIVSLHAIASDLGWSHDQSHRRAGVESFNHLTRSQAAILHEGWSSLSRGPGAPEPPDQPPEPTSPANEPQRLDPSDSLPSLDELWSLAVGVYGSRVGVLKAALARRTADRGISASSLTAEELLELLDSEEDPA